MSLCLTIRHASPLLLALPLLGCSSSSPLPKPPEPVAAPQLAYDEAQQIRRWPRTEVRYASDDVRAGRDVFPLEYQPGGEEADAESNRGSPQFDRGRRGSLARVFEPLSFLGNAILLPYNLLVGERGETYEGLRLAPTYHAVPPLPPRDVAEESDQETPVRVISLPPAPRPVMVPTTRPLPSTLPTTRRTTTRP
jgi:hypothetical protein